jgi:AcrR family transcriptional regulator
MPKAVKRTRTYDSSRRQAQARQTQLAVITAAQKLFIERGYGRTTVAQIAEAAEVSVETVYGAFGNKAALLHRVWDITIGGDDEEVAFHERPEVLAIRAEPDLAKRLIMQAELVTKTARRTAPFLLALQGAAGVEQAAADMLAEIDRQREVGMTIQARELAMTGQLAVSEQEAKDVLWSFSEGTLWHRLVEQRGWTDEHFSAWLGRMWVAMLVGSTRPASRRTGRAGA